MKSLRFLERDKSRKAMKVAKVKRKSSYLMGITAIRTSLPAFTCGMSIQSLDIICHCLKEYRIGYS